MIFWPLMTVGLGADLWTKKAVFDWLLDRDEPFVSIIDGFFQLVLAVNEGAAFGIAAGNRILLIAVSVIALIAVFSILFFSRNAQKIFYVALGLFAGGICGNLYDRIFNDGKVRDFIDVYYGSYHWPAFNIADSMLCIAVGLIVIHTIIGRPGRKHARQQK